MSNSTENTEHVLIENKNKFLSTIIEFIVDNILLIGIGLFGISLLLLLVFLENKYTLNEFFKRFIEDIGFAFIVASIVAFAFDRVYHKKMFLTPLAMVSENVKKSTREIQSASNSLQDASHDLKIKLMDFSRTLSSTEAEGIVAIYRREKNLELKEEISNAIRRAKTYLYIQGQIFENLLVEIQENDHVEPSVSTITKRLTDSSLPKLDLKICLYDTLGSSDTLKKEGMSDKQIVSSRTSIKEILAAVSKIADNRVCLRLTQDKPMHGIILTDDYLFLEHYIPNSRHNPILVFKALSKESLGILGRHKVQDNALNRIGFHDSYQKTFEEAFRKGKKISYLIEKYITDRLSNKLKKSINLSDLTANIPVEPKLQEWILPLAMARTLDKNETDRELTKAS